MSHPLVVHRSQPHDVYIGRPSEWGNPFIIGRNGSREDVITKYETFVRGNPDFIARIKLKLKGKKLGCWCAPLPCHGDILAKIANE